MSNSAMVVHTNISPHRTSPRNAKIDTITIHCVVGQVTAESLGNWFKQASTKASSNYSVDKDGRVGMYVEEKDRSWCTSSSANDNRAITIEVASDTTYPYKVTDKAFAGLLDLVTDICKRNGIKRLLWKADKSLVGQVDKQNMSVHRWFANKACPGDYLYNLHSAIAEEVNRRLNGDAAPNPETPTAPEAPAAVVKAGDTVKLSENATYYDGKDVPAWVKSQNWIVASVKGDRAVIDKNVSGSNSINSPVNTKFLTVVGGATAPTAPAFEPYMVKVTANVLNIRRSPGTDAAVVGAITDKGVYTIVEEADVGGAKWGRLKSGAGWISLAHTVRR